MYPFEVNKLCTDILSLNLSTHPRQRRMSTLERLTRRPDDERRQATRRHRSDVLTQTIDGELERTTQTGRQRSHERRPDQRRAGTDDTDRTPSDVLTSWNEMTQTGWDGRHRPDAKRRSHELERDDTDRLGRTTHTGRQATFSRNEMTQTGRSTTEASKLASFKLSECPQRQKARARPPLRPARPDRRSRFTKRSHVRRLQFAKNETVGNRSENRGIV